MLLKLLPVLCTALPLVLSQSNYASQGNSIEYQPGLPPSTVLNGKVTKLDDISSMIFLNRTKAYLNCSQGSMQVELKFEEPFHGVAYADFDRNSACIFKGRGSTSAKLELPLKGIYIYIYSLSLFLLSISSLFLFSTDSKEDSCYQIEIKFSHLSWIFSFHIYRENTLFRLV